MRPLLWIVTLAAVLSVSGACTRDPERASSAQSTAESAQEGLVQLEDFRLGTALGSDGAIAPGKQQNAFTPDETVFLAMRIRQAPVGAAVRVVWGAPGGIQLGEETKTIRPGQRYLHFAADISTIPVGENYYAEVWAQGRQIARVEFSIIDEIGATASA